MTSEDLTSEHLTTLCDNGTIRFFGQDAYSSGLYVGISDDSDFQK